MLRNWINSKGKNYLIGSTNIEFMNSLNTILIILDLQERLISRIDNKKLIVWNSEKLIDSAKIMGLEVLSTEQNPMKLGHNIQSIQEKVGTASIPKMEFSCNNNKELNRRLEESEIRNIVLCGVETHICIQQSAIGFLSSGYNVYIAVDAVGSRRTGDHETSIKELRSIGARIYSTEAIMFEWCKTSDRKEFKSISNIAKKSLP